MNTKWQFTYQDFDGLTKSSVCDVFEPEPGVFYAQNLETFGCGKRVDASVYWHPIKVAIADLIGGRVLKSYGGL